MRQNPHVRICGGARVSNDPGLPDPYWSHGWLLSLWHWAPRSRPLVLYQFKDMTPHRSAKIQAWHIIGEETVILRFIDDYELSRLAPGVCRVSDDGHVRYRGVYQKRFVGRFRRVLRGRGAQLDVRYERPSLSDHLDFLLQHFGDVHLRWLLTHGGRAVLRTSLRRAQEAPDQLTRLQQWAVTTAARRGNHKATIAIANKLARIVWAVWRREETFHPQPRLIAAA